VLRHLPVDPDLLVHSGIQRSRHLNRQLAWPLAFVAGAINAGGFFAVGIYTSHITGSLSRAVDELALAHMGTSLFFLTLVGAFFAGAYSGATFVHLGMRRRFRSPYGGVLFLEALLLMAFGAVAQHRPFGSNSDLFNACILSYFMGMLNAVATIISASELRVTHMTGILTDLGIELARLFYWNRKFRPKVPAVVANRYRLRLHGGILAFFGLGGWLGALSFKRWGFAGVFPLAAILFTLSLRPVLRDLRIRTRLIRWS
jgi:uncharacterized membrane protein YoaK (UPF0700 family)